VNGSKALFVLLLLVTLAGCQHNPYADWFVKKDVPESALVGSYHVTDETVEFFSTRDMAFMPRHRLPITRQAKIVLDKDHKMSLSRIPIDLGEPPLCILDGEGTWDVMRTANTWISISISNSKPSGPGCPAGKVGLQLELFDDSKLHVHSNTKYPLLHLIIGDPDSGDAVQFEKH
jgi:hypothetical protein